MEGVGLQLFHAHERALPRGHVHERALPHEHAHALDVCEPDKPVHVRETTPGVHVLALTLADALSLVRELAVVPGGWYLHEDFELTKND